MHERATATPAETFAHLWDALCGMLGCAATATVLRRCQTTMKPPVVRISRVDLEYRYVVPETWSRDDEESRSAIRDLVSAVQPLLQELTGSLVLKRLASIPEIREMNLGLNGE